MKKQIKRLSLGKRTISNLSAAEMNRQIGGNQTQKGNTCTNHDTCNTNTTTDSGYCSFACSYSVCGNATKHGCSCTA